MKVSGVIASALACSALSVGISWPTCLQDVKNPLAVAQGHLHARQNENSSNGNPESSTSVQPSTATSNDAEQSSTPTSNTVTAAPESSGDANSDSNSSSGANGSSGSGSSTRNNPTATKSGSTQTSLVAISPQDPAGGLSMITPAATAAQPYYKVGQTVTWVWNYTSLLRAPKHIDILASVAAGANYAIPSPFTLAVNETFNPTQTFTWDTGKYYSETSHLPIATYTLVVYDADATGGVSQTPSPGYLGVWQQFRFGMYTPQAYSPLESPYTCVTCNSAASLERMTIGAMLATAGMTVASFMWFSGGLRLVL